MHWRGVPMVRPARAAPAGLVQQLAGVGPGRVAGVATEHPGELADPVVVGNVPRVVTVRPSAMPFSTTWCTSA